jgi:hypothetical protein
VSHWGQLVHPYLGITSIENKHFTNIFENETYQYPIITIFKGYLPKMEGFPNKYPVR